jgi:hypothetical protein
VTGGGAGPDQPGFAVNVWRFGQQQSAKFTDSSSMLLGLDRRAGRRDVGLTRFGGRVDHAIDAIADRFWTSIKNAFHVLTEELVAFMAEVLARLRKAGDQLEFRGCGSDGDSAADDAAPDIGGVR